MFAHLTSRQKVDVEVKNGLTRGFARVNYGSVLFNTQFLSGLSHPVEQFCRKCGVINLVKAVVVVFWNNQDMGRSLGVYVFEYDIFGRIQNKFRTKLTVCNFAKNTIIFFHAKPPFWHPALAIFPNSLYDYTMKIGIIGLGLIGGSILKSLTDKGFELYAVTGNEKTAAAVQGFCAVVSDDMAILSGCEVVFVAVPMNKTLETLDRLEKILPPSAIVADVSSLKDFVMQKKRPYVFIGSHPMAGTENSGWGNSFSTLFEGKTWALTPFCDEKSENIEKLSYIIKKTGAKTLICDSKEHDEAAAMISHMPMYLSQALFAAASDNELAMELASTGFESMTRLAMENTEMAEDMVNMNWENIEKSLNKLTAALQTLKTGYRPKIEKIKQDRKKLI